MEWKYKLIFLLVLLCLARIEKSYSQNCITMQYDNNGNRVSMFVHECGCEYKSSGTSDIMNNEISQDDNNRELMLYPNPNDGIFNITMSDDNKNPIAIHLYNINGVMVMNGNLSDNKMIDISYMPSGVYLLKIIQGESACSKIVVKL